MNDELKALLHELKPYIEWFLIAVTFFVLAKTYNDHAFVVWGKQGVALQTQLLIQETRVADAMDRAYPLPLNLGNLQSGSLPSHIICEPKNGCFR